MGLSAMPSPISATPMITKMIAVTVRPTRPPATSGEGSTAAPVAAIGETWPTRLVPTQAAIHVVAMTRATATSVSGSKSGYPRPAGKPPNCSAMATPPATSPVATTKPARAPRVPMTRPSRATEARMRFEVEPMSRYSAIVRVRPAMIVEKVFAVTIAATYSAMPMNTNETARNIMRKVAEPSMRFGSSAAASTPVVRMSVTASTVESAETTIVAPCPWSLSLMRSPARGSASCTRPALGSWLPSRARSARQRETECGRRSSRRPGRG